MGMQRDGWERVRIEKSAGSTVRKTRKTVLELKREIREDFMRRHQFRRSWILTEFHVGGLYEFHVCGLGHSRLPLCNEDREGKGGATRCGCSGWPYLFASHIAQGRSPASWRLRAHDQKGHTLHRRKAWVTQIGAS
eukprot:2525535-Pleurochrysis_carterae.AAC.1